MARRKSANPNHPKKGSTIKVEPIRDLKAVKRIKKLLSDNPRDSCLFTLGINTAYRANELVSLTVGQVDHLQVGDRLELKQSKTKKHRGIIINPTVLNALEKWLDWHPDPRARQPLFASRKSGTALTVPSVVRLVKKWCNESGLHGNYGSHTLRKTWGYHQLRINNAPIPLLMEAYGHSTQAQTLAYLCIEAEEISELYSLEL